MLTMRKISPNDHRIREDGQPIGRLRFASERLPGVWLWHVTVNIPGPQSTGSATRPGQGAVRGGMAGVQGEARAEAFAAAYRAMNKRKEP